LPILFLRSRFLTFGFPAGTYRLRYFGDSKPLIGSISAFTGTSGNFTIA
jgi:neutral ceramidase